MEPKGDPQTPRDQPGPIPSLPRAVETEVVVSPVVRVQEVQRSLARSLGEICTKVAVSKDGHLPRVSGRATSLDPDLL